MKHPPNTPIHQPVPIRNLTITTALRLHPDFSTAPRAFARRYGVDLADDVFPETDFRKDPDSEDLYIGEKVEETKSNIHLVQHGAIRLFTERDADGCDWVWSIGLNPSLLLHGAERHLLSEGDLRLSLSTLRKKVLPLLAERLDARHIVPGLVHDGEPVAYWSSVDSEILIPGVEIPCLHGLSHPGTGPAAGGMRNRIQLADKKDDCLIRFEKAQWESPEPDGMQIVEGVRVRLILKGRQLTSGFEPFGTIALIDGNRCLVAFPEPGVAHVHQAVMSHLEGTYLPVPPEWGDGGQGKPVTHAKAIALVSQLTSMPVEEILEMDEEVRHPSDSTRKRLNKDVPVEVGRLMPVPVSTLFGSEVYATRGSGRAPQTAGRIDPLIAAVYGQG